MRSLRPEKRRHLVAFGLFVPTLIAMLLTTGFFQWSPLNCWHDDVDINTGCVRHSRYMLFCKIADHTEETWLSSVTKDLKTVRDWRRVKTFSPGVRHSPHYRFHGAIQQIKTLEGGRALPRCPRSLTAVIQAKASGHIRIRNRIQCFQRCDELIQLTCDHHLSLAFDEL